MLNCDHPRERDRILFVKFMELGSLMLHLVRNVAVGAVNKRVRILLFVLTLHSHVIEGVVMLFFLLILCLWLLVAILASIGVLL